MDIVALGLTLLGFANTASQVSRPSVSDLAERTIESIPLLVTYDSSGKALSTGSGVVVSDSGIVVTNLHVFEGASKALAKFSSGAFFPVKGFVAVDRRNDLILLQLDGHGFKPVEIGSSTSLRLGDEVVAIGSPMALEGTVSTGIVSAIRTDQHVEKAIQTSAPISPGSSGGALLDRAGRLVGITTYEKAGGQALNFAVAAELVQRLLSAPRELRNLSDLRDGVDQAQFLTALPQGWTRTPDGSEWLIRRVGGTIYSQLVPNVVDRNRGVASVCEYNYDFEADRWWGDCSAQVAVRCALRSFCRIELIDAFVRLTPQLISGVGFKIDEIDCDTCKPKFSEPSEFSLLPSTPVRQSESPRGTATTGRGAGAPPKVTATINGKIVEEAVSGTSFGWIVEVTSTADMAAEAQIQFLDAEGFIVATALESGLRLAAGATGTYRGTTKLSVSLAAKVVRLGVKITARR